MRFRRWVEVLWLFDRLPWYSWPESEPLAKRRSPHFVEHAGLTLQKQVRTTLCPTHLVVHDNSLASLEILPQLPLITIIQCLELSIPRFETIQPVISVRVLISLLTFGFNERWILPNSSIPATLGLAMS